MSVGFVELAPNVRGWTRGVPVEPEALQQLRNIASLPILAGPVAVMPDVHLGKGATVGSVIVTRAAVIPAAVGVDLGCGMIAVRTSLKASDLPDSLARLRADIEAAIPVGFDMHRQPVRTLHSGREGKELAARTRRLTARLKGLRIMAQVGKVDEDRVWRQLGTLGSGNHFIEVCLSEEQDVWLMLHSGSRSIGKVFADAAISMAKELAHRRDRRLPDMDLAWLDEGTGEFAIYTEALSWAQDYATQNRDVMLHLLLGVMRKHFGDRFHVAEQAVNCHHNYAQQEIHFGQRVWVTRKGAVSARAGELGIIPGNMGARSYIVRGRGNPHSYCSCSHGAGRVLSRAAAKRRFRREDLLAQTRGVECRKDPGVLDEIPAAYKDIDAVMAAQQDLVETVAVLKQVVCVKG